MPTSSEREGIRQLWRESGVQVRGGAQKPTADPASLEYALAWWARPAREDASASRVEVANRAVQLGARNVVADEGVG